MITFYIIRHGTKEAVSVDPQLTEAGKKQAQLTGEFLKNIKFKKVVASPKFRTLETATQIAKQHNLKVETDERLRERMEWEGGTFEEFVNEWNETDRNRNLQPSNGMSSLEKGKAVRSVLDEITNQESDGEFAIVTHGGTIGDLLRNLFNESSLNHITHPKYNVRYIEILECSITKIIYDNGAFTLASVNDTSHLS